MYEEHSFCLCDRNLEIRIQTIMQTGNLCLKPMKNFIEFPLCKKSNDIFHAD